MPLSDVPPAPDVPSWLQGRRIGSPDSATREAHSQQLLEEATVAPDEDLRRRLLDQVVLINVPVAESIAARYRSRGIEAEDLVQVAYLGLVKATQGYRLGEGNGFLAYAVPTISGEIKRHFRDFGWLVRPPRRLQELRSQLTTTRLDLQQAQGRAPTSQEMAQSLGIDYRELAEAELADGCFVAVSLDSPVRGVGTAALADGLVDEADHFDHVETVESLRPALLRLGARDRLILALRFEWGLTQEEIGRHIGVSQMQVSRLLARIMDELRADLVGAESAG